MALTAGRWWLYVELAETSNKRTTKRFEMDAPADYATALSNASGIITDLLAVTDCVVTKYYVTQEYVEDALSLPASAEIQNQALIQVSIVDEPTKTGTIAIPGASAGIFAGASGPNYDIVDVVDTDLGNFIDHWVTDGHLLVSDGETAEALLSGHRRHTGHNSS